MSFVYRTQVHFEDSQIDSFSFVMKVPTDAVLQKIHEIAASSQVCLISNEILGV